MKKESWSVTADAFDRLLAALDTDRERAGEKYELLRRKLVRYFEWRGAPFPEDLADETLNVAARRLAEGEPIQNLNAYCGGIARMILLEKLRQQEKERSALQDADAATPFGNSLEEEARLECFERCLEQLPPEDRKLILSYYQGEQKAKIKGRKALAEELGIPLNALRIRAHRIRVHLEGVVRQYTERRQNRSQHNKP